VTKQRALTSWKWQREGQSGHGKKATEQGALTDWRWQREGQVRTWRESNRARGTYILEMAEKGKSGHGKNATKQGALTDYMEEGGTS